MHAFFHMVWICNLSFLLVTSIFDRVRDSFQSAVFLMKGYDLVLCLLAQWMPFCFHLACIHNLAVHLFPPPHMPSFFKFLWGNILFLLNRHVELRQTLMSVSTNCHLIERLFFESSKTGIVPCSMFSLPSIESKYCFLYFMIWENSAHYMSSIFR